VTGYPEAPRQLRFDLHRASFHLEHLVALVTVKVVMVLLSSHFVTGRITGNLHWSQPFVLHQRSDVPIHGRDADPLDLLLSER